MNWIPAMTGVGARVVAGCAVLGAALWAAALDWGAPGYPVPGGTLDAPYDSARMLPWALAVLVAVAVLSWWRHPVVVGCGVAGGSWVAFTGWTALYPDAGATWAVTPILLLVPLGIGTALAAALGSGVRAHVDRRRRTGPTGPG